MKLYQIFDNGTLLCTTTDMHKAFALMLRLHKKYEKQQDWFWIDAIEVK